MGVRLPAGTAPQVDVRASARQLAAAVDDDAPLGGLDEARPDDVLDVLREGTKRANVVAEETLQLAKRAMKQDYFGRRLTIE